MTSDSRPVGWSFRPDVTSLNGLARVSIGRALGTIPDEVQRLRDRWSSWTIMIPRLGGNPLDHYRHYVLLRERQLTHEVRVYGDLQDFLLICQQELAAGSTRPPSVSVAAAETPLTPAAVDRISERQMLRNVFRQSNSHTRQRVETVSLLVQQGWSEGSAGVLLEQLDRLHWRLYRERHDLSEDQQRTIGHLQRPMPDGAVWVLARMMLNARGEGRQLRTVLLSDYSLIQYVRGIYERHEERINRGSGGTTPMQGDPRIPFPGDSDERAPLVPIGAVTGRWSSENPNPASVPHHSTGLRATLERLRDEAKPIPQRPGRRLNFEE